ncbi:hypothetical protein ABPG75_006944 [Micractinium tetrahymenae]
MLICCPGQQLRPAGRALAAPPPRSSVVSLHRNAARVGAAAGVWGSAAPGGDGASAGGESSDDGVGPWHLKNDHLLPAHAGDDPTVAAHGGTANGDGKLHHLPASLFANFPKLPPDGSTLTPEEVKCSPDAERCRTPIHVWESKCSACAGTGTARSYSSRGRHRLVTVCLLCHGLGYVRHSSTHASTVPYVNGSGPHTTIGRPSPPERKPPRQHPLPGSMQYRPPPRRP